jgi:hypothetical protein
MKPKKIITVGFTAALVLPLGAFSHAEEFEAPHVHVEVIDGPHEAMLIFLGVPSITGNVVDVVRPFQTTSIFSSGDFFAARFVRVPRRKGQILARVDQRQVIKPGHQFRKIPRP